jgi:hypothetical protein
MFDDQIRSIVNSKWDKVDTFNQDIIDFENKSTGDNFIIYIFHFNPNFNFTFVAIFC